MSPAEGEGRPRGIDEGDHEGQDESPPVAEGIHEGNADEDGFGSVPHPGEEEPEGEELVNEDAMRDYEAMPHLDVYEEEGLARESDVEDNPYREARARVEAEEAMAARDAREGRLGTGRRRPRALQGARLPSPPLGFIQGKDLMGARPQRTRKAWHEGGREGGSQSKGWRTAWTRTARRCAVPQPSKVERACWADMQLAQEDFEERMENIEDVKGKLADWLKHSNVRREVMRRFKRFLRNYDPTPNEAPKGAARSRNSYHALIAQMVIHNEQSLEVLPPSP